MGCKDTMSNIKILISCHKPTQSLESDIMTQIQVGCANQKKRFAGMLRDDEGENISAKNPMYCELTAQYWAWKNLKADYYGFFHYRRYLNFSEKTYPVDVWGNVIEEYLTQESAEKYNLNDQVMRRIIEENDIVISEMKNILAMPKQGKNIYEQYKGGNSLHIQDLDIVCDIVRKKYPEYNTDLNEYLQGKDTCFCNMFVMKKALFYEYSEWLFDILEEFEKKADMSSYSVEGLRTPGHLAERLLTLFYLHIKRTRKLKIKTLQTVVFLNTEPENEIFPAYENNNVAIFLSANDFYVPYVSVVLESLKYNATKNKNYDVIIVHHDISEKNQTILKKQLETEENISLRFFQIKRYGKMFESLFLRGHFVLETYYRLLMPEILKHYKKALYIDSDLVLNSDPADLFETDVDGFLLAACRDADTAGLYNGYEPNKKEYMDKILKIKNPYDYFQAGVILFNLEEFRKKYTTKKMLTFAGKYKWQLLDQDVLNYLAQGRVRYVNMSWNVMTDWAGIRINQIISLAPHYLNKEYMEARNNPKIIHYAGPDKPWNQPFSDMAEYFWKFARNTPFYEVILQRMCAQPYLPGIEVKIKNKIKKCGMEMVNSVFPLHTQRRERLKKIVKKIL